jgi:hypothetical protein
MVPVILLLLVGIVGLVIWKTRFQKKALSPIRSQMSLFRTRGNQVKPTDLLAEMVNLDRVALQRQGGFFEFYPNQKIVVFVIPPSTQVYCICNLMQYMDLTRAIEKKVLYGINPPPLNSFEVAA